MMTESAQKRGRAKHGCHCANLDLEVFTGKQVTVSPKPQYLN